jgi:hypothetical protein
VEGIQFILLSLLYFVRGWNYSWNLLLGGDFHVAGSREQKRVRLYGKYNYYLIFPKKILGSYGAVNIIILSRNQVERQ